jgi:hypothetical protein
MLTNVCYVSTHVKGFLKALTLMYNMAGNDEPTSHSPLLDVVALFLQLSWLFGIPFVPQKIVPSLVVCMEAQFLASQNERVAALKEREATRLAAESTVLAIATERSLETRWNAWKAQLVRTTTATVATDKTATRPLISSEQERRELQLALDALQEELYAQRRQVSCNEALPDASLLRWHRRLVIGQGDLDTARQTLLPKGKFIFRRYRQALASRQEERNRRPGQVPDDDPADDKAPPAAVEVVEEEASLGNCLEDYCNAQVSLDGDWVESISSKTGEVTRVDLSGQELPLVWRRLEDCTVHWKSATSDTAGLVLHLVNLRDCQLTVDVPLSSIHATDCHQVTLRVWRSQQVRLHTSTNLQVWGHITGGTILEGCRGIGITTNCPNVQDFGWLKAGQPSPNLERLPEEPPARDVANATTRVRTTVALPSEAVPNAATVAAHGHGEEGNDEDEL